jgi:hydrogenase-4 component E
MEQIAQILLISILFLSLYLLGISSLAGCVNIVAIEGYCLGLLPLFIHERALTIQGFFLAILTTTLKGWLIPKVLFYAIREVKVRHEVEPLVGYVSSLLIGTGIIATAFALSERLPIPPGLSSGLLVPIALATLIMGLFMTISRLKAITQVVGYLVFENGIYLFGLAISYDMPWLLEIGVLLDVFVAVFIMGIIIYHISREFDSIHTDRLTQLRD